mgnify:CR=1 FL=1
MPALLLIGIPIAVVVLFLGIMSLPDEGMKNELMDEKKAPPEKKKGKKK